MSANVATNPVRQIARNSDDPTRRPEEWTSPAQTGVLSILGLDPDFVPRTKRKFQRKGAKGEEDLQNAIQEFLHFFAHLPLCALALNRIFLKFKRPTIFGDPAQASRILAEQEYNA